MSLIPRYISVTIQASPEKVYQYASRPEKMPEWAAGLSGSIRQEGDHWISESPMGKVKVYFTKENGLGVIDHDVILETGRRFHNPMRVLKNGDSAEVVFTLYRQPEMSDAEFDRDAEMVRNDLLRLKKILEL